jgi:hypothetical protein
MTACDLRPVTITACRLLIPACLWCLAAVDTVCADGAGIDKIYHPYVQPLEREVELRATIEDGSNALSEDRQTWRLGYGQSFGENWFGEMYVIAEQNKADSLAVKKYEIEALRQLTEQGEFPVDAGVLFAFEKADSDDIMEFASTLLLEKEWGQWAGTANIRAMYEFGDDISNELEVAAALQLRYRYRREIEPALEFYSSQNILGLGPVLLGDLRLGQGHRLHWEMGVIAGLGKQTPDSSFRLLLEYEF